MPFISKCSVLSANKYGLNEIKNNDVSYASWWNAEHQIAYNCGINGIDLSIQPIVKGWRRGKAPESGISYNHRDQCSENGLSMMSVNGSEAGFSEMFMAERKKYEYEGILLPYSGSDGEPLIIPFGLNIDLD